MKQPIKIDVLLDFKEYLYCNYLIVRKKLLHSVILLGVIFLSGVILACLKIGVNFDAFKAILIFFALLVIFVFLFLYFLYRNLRKAFNSTPILKQKISYHLSENGVEAHGDSFTSIVGWDTFSKAEETANYFLVYVGPASAYIFPQRCFENESQITDFRGLVGRKLGRIDTKEENKR